MKLLVFCLLAVTCCALAKDSDVDRKLQETSEQLTVLKKYLQHTDVMLNTPQNTECCSEKALDCFQSNLTSLSVTKKITQTKLRKSLRNPLTKTAMKSLDAECTPRVCETCDSYPKKNATDFINELESLIQKARSTLSRIAQ